MHFLMGASILYAMSRIGFAVKMAAGFSREKNYRSDFPPGTGRAEYLISTY